MTKADQKRMQDEGGFSLVEVLVAMGAFVIFMVAMSGIFVPLVNQYKQQSKIVETSFEGVVGLELLRMDIENAGLGLPWSLLGVDDVDDDDDFWEHLVYSEAASVGSPDGDPAVYNDVGGAPRAIVSGDAQGPINGSDYLVVKSVVAARSDAAHKWTYITEGEVPHEWGAVEEDLENGDRVIVMMPTLSEQDSMRNLVVNDTGQFFTVFSSAGLADPANFEPRLEGESFLIFGIKPPGNPAVDPRMPFNRADHYISTANVPTKCARGTGVLRKSVISHADGIRRDNLPILDCVADFQVAFGLDQDDDGRIDCYANNLQDALGVNYDAVGVRERIKEVRVYALGHEGQFDRTYTIDLGTLNAGLDPAIACGTCIRVGEGVPQGLARCEDAGDLLGQDRDLATIGLELWRNYRWKVFTLVVTPDNLE